MAINATQVANELISYAIITDKNGVVKLLERNGIQMPNNPSDNEVTLAVLMANAKSGTFRNDLTNYLTNKSVKATKEFASFAGDDRDFGFTGIDDFSFVGEDEYHGFLGIGKGQGFLGLGKKNPAAIPTAPKAPALTSAQKKAARVSADNPQGKTKTGLALASIGGFLKDTVLNQENVNAGIQIGLQSISNKTQAQQNALQAQALQLQQTQDELKNVIPGAKKSNTSTYVFIGVGVLAIALIGFAIYKARKK